VNNEPTIESSGKVVVWILASALATILMLAWLCGCASSVVKNSSTTVPMPPMPTAAPALSMVQNSVVAPSGLTVTTITFTWQDSAAGLWNTGLRGTNYLMNPFTNAPVIYDAVAQISNSFTLTSTNQSFFAIAFNTNLNTNL
jgi:hypothetical protein